MKHAKLALFAAGCGLLASCSSEEPVANVPAELVDGYASFEITLPTSTGTRADDEQPPYTFEEGTEDEYAVINGKALVFQNAGTEANATFVSMADLSGMNWSQAAAGEITTTSTCVAQLTDIDMKNPTQYSVVIVLNYNGEFKFPTKGQTFGEWSKTAQTSNMILDGKYLTMTNAAEFTSATTDPKILVGIDKTKIAQSESSIKGSAATFHVQRAVSKVTVSTSASYNVAGSAYTGDKVSINAWALDVTNKTTFPVQVTSGLMGSYAGIWGKARFSGAENAKFRRVFWALDPNYENAVAADFNFIGNANVTKADPQAYCLENTFCLNGQRQGQTTRVVLKGTYTPNSLPGYKAGDAFFKIGSSTALWTATTLADEIKAKAVLVFKNNNVEVALGKVATAAGFYSLKDLSIKVNGNELGDASRSKVAVALGLANADDKGIATYYRGETYYVARIKHFGDAETPWELGDPAEGNPAYGGDNDKWLGRYGMVRNTAYEVKVNSISNPGSPVVPVIDPDEPDDVDEYHIQVSINMLPWAKRVNNVDL